MHLDPEKTKFAQKIAGIFIYFLIYLFVYLFIYFFFLLKHAPIQYIKLWEATRNRCKSRAL